MRVQICPLPCPALEEGSRDDIPPASGCGAEEREALTGDVACTASCVPSFSFVAGTVLQNWDAVRTKQKKKIYAQYQYVCTISLSLHFSDV